MQSETQSAPAPASRGRAWLPYVLGGLAVLAVCALVACVLIVAIAVRDYALYVPGGAGTAQASSPEAVRAEVQALPEGDPAAGEQVFTGEAGCTACHSLTPGEIKVGPSLAGAGERAATRRPGYTAEMYLYESISNPGAYTVQSFPAGAMPKNFKQRLSQQQLADLVAFLASK